jgi:thiamine biosynthesis lipoprotein ApbE
VFLNKPKYLPKDTVRFKVVLMDKKGRYLDKPFLDVKIGGIQKGY